MAARKSAASAAEAEVAQGAPAKKTAAAEAETAKAAPAKKARARTTKKTATAETPAKKAPPAEARFSRGQLLASKRYANRRDMISALLEPDKTYTAAEVEQMIENYRKGKVK